MAAWIRRSSQLLLRETASFARSAVSSRPDRPAYFRSFAAAASKQAGASVASKKAGSAVSPRKTAAAAKSTGPRSPTGIMKPRRVSPEMQKFLGSASEVPRTQALKEIWAYIKQNNLQDPANKKIIVCDEKLKTIFAGKERVGFLEIAGLISAHFLK